MREPREPATTSEPQTPTRCGPVAWHKHAENDQAALIKAKQTPSPCTSRQVHPRAETHPCSQQDVCRKVLSSAAWNSPKVEMPRWPATVG